MELAAERDIVELALPGGTFGLAEPLWLELYSPRGSDLDYHEIGGGSSIHW